MLKSIAFGLCCGAGLQAWRHWPPDGPVTATGAAFVLVVAVLAAYFGGRWHGRQTPVSAWASARADATATATAQQQQSVNVAVLVPGSTGAGARATSTLDALPWLGASQLDVTEVSELLEGFDVAELSGEYDTGAER